MKLGKLDNQTVNTPPSFALAVTEQQLNIIRVAVDLYGRLLRGQIESELWNLFAFKDFDDGEFKRIATELKSLIFPELGRNSSFGVGWGKTGAHQNAQIAYEIGEMITYYLAQNSGDGNPFQQPTLPLHYSTESLVEINEIKELLEKRKK